MKKTFIFYMIFTPIFVLREGPHFSQSLFFVIVKKEIQERRMSKWLVIPSGTI